MGHYVRHRQANGRFRKSSLSRDFGIKAWACAFSDCRGFNPTNVGEPKPETCRHCKRPFVDIAEGVRDPEQQLDRADDEGTTKPVES